MSSTRKGQLAAGAILTSLASFALVMQLDGVNLAQAQERGEEPGGQQQHPAGQQGNAGQARQSARRPTAPSSIP
ncbi:MAG: hypothetical protein AB7O32_04225 [Vicinamibacterales bacterium]